MTGDASRLLVEMRRQVLSWRRHPNSWTPDYCAIELERLLGELEAALSLEADEPHDESACFDSQVMGKGGCGSCRHCLLIRAEVAEAKLAKVISPEAVPSAPAGHCSAVRPCRILATDSGAWCPSCRRREGMEARAEDTP